MEITTSGDIPSPRFRFGYTDAVHNGTRYFFVFSGVTDFEKSKELFALNLETWVWKKLPRQGEAPNPKIGPTLDYYEGFLYLVGGDARLSKYPRISDFYRYDLANSRWENITSSKTYTHRYLHGTCIYQGYFYLFYGWSNLVSYNIDLIQRVDLKSSAYEWEDVSVNRKEDYHEILRSAYGYSCFEGKFHMVGGYSSESLRNSVVEFDLNKDPLEYRVLADEYTGPLSRAEHSLAVINKNFYMFGGINNQKILGDFWKYQEDLDLWTEVNAEGINPSERLGHAATAFADNLVIWGGENDSGLLNDAYLYNAYLNLWRKVTPSGGVPSPRKNLCAVMIKNQLYLYGGNSYTGISSELWKLDLGLQSYELLSKDDSKGPGPVSYHRCSYEANRENLGIYVMMGQTKTKEPLGQVYYFNLKTLAWQKVFDEGYNEFLNRASASVVKLQNEVFVLGGKVWDTLVFSSFFSLDLDNSEYTYHLDFDQVVFGAAYVYYKDYLYVHGGGSSAETAPETVSRSASESASDSASRGGIRKYIPTNSFKRIHMRTLTKEPLCSPGTFENQGTCSVCPKGTFSSVYGAHSCTKCPSGTYNTFEGSNSIYQCRPCPEDHFCPNDGTVFLYQCSGYQVCYVGSVQPTYQKIERSQLSLQPDFYIGASESYESFIYSNRFVFGFIGVLFLASVLSIKKLRNLVSKIDIFKSSHNYTLDHPMVYKKTFLGGFFGCAFMVFALLLAGEALLVFIYDNLEETKTLVPYVVLEKENDNINGDLEVKLKLHYYGGQCILEGVCHPTISLAFESIQGDLETGCQVFDKTGCLIHIVCRNCQTLTGSKISLEISELFSYASAIQLEMNSTSSIPDQQSSVVQTIAASKHKVFVGSLPSVFYVGLIPSVSFTQVFQDLDTQKTGYHLSGLVAPSEGSQHEVQE